MFEPAASRVAAEGVFPDAALNFVRPGRASLIVLRIAEVREKEVVCAKLADDIVRL